MDEGDTAERIVKWARLKFRLPKTLFVDFPSIAGAFNVTDAYYG